MKRAATIEEFLDSPVGCYSAGATHIVWCHSPTLTGTVHWGRPTDGDAALLVRRLAIVLHPALNAVDSFVDASGMESFDWNAFVVLSEYIKSRMPDWSRRIRRQAVVVPSGAVGAIVAGLLPLLGPDYPLRFFGSEDEAVQWMHRDDLARVLDEVRSIADEVCGVAPIVRGVRDYLDGALADATLGTAASALGLSGRSLQRELKLNGTHFTAELMRARIGAARELLEYSELKIDSIARRVGCVSSSHLSELFRRHVGETPAQYRASRRRPGDSG